MRPSRTSSAARLCWLSALIHDPVARVAALSFALAGTFSFAGVFWTIPSGFLSGASAAGGLAAISAVGHSSAASCRHGSSATSRT